MGAGFRLTGEARLSDLAGNVDLSSSGCLVLTEGRGGRGGLSDSSSCRWILCDRSPKSCEDVSL